MHSSFKRTIYKFIQQKYLSIIFLPKSIHEDQTISLIQPKKLFETVWVKIHAHIYAVTQTSIEKLQHPCLSLTDIFITQITRKNYIFHCTASAGSGGLGNTPITHQEVKKEHRLFINVRNPVTSTSSDFMDIKGPQTTTKYSNIPHNPTYATLTLVRPAVKCFVPKWFSQCKYNSKQFQSDYSNTTFKHPNFASNYSRAEHSN